MQAIYDAYLYHTVPATTPMTPTTASLIYPHQMYASHPAVAPGRLHVLVEDTLYFGDKRYAARFHRLKLAYHRASMKRYQAVTLAGHETQYVDYIDEALQGRGLFEHLAQRGITQVNVVDPTDDVLMRRIRRWCSALGLTLTVHDTPNFLTTVDEIDEYFTMKPKYYQTDFYVWQRKRLGLYVTPADDPVGGKWTYDTANRRKIGRDVQLPAEPLHYDNDYIAEARTYVQQHFAGNPGSMEHFIYPISHEEATAQLHLFLQGSLHDFGTYQDAISQRGPFLFHSMISAALNSGLLSPGQVVDALVDAHDANPDIRFASVEGYLRQVIGWREFVRAIYLREGVELRNSNFFGQLRGLTDAWYEGTTGIVPVDDVIRKTLDYAYGHHIERLMVMGNIMLLCELHPSEVYQWFTEMFIDAYDWVMVPNVYAMSQYAAGGLMTTKPYISSSNYIRKMSDYGSKGEWQQTWDSLYWHFILKHLHVFAENPRLAVMTTHTRRMDDDTREAHHQRAQTFIDAVTD